MTEEPATFFSDGLQFDASSYWPEEPALFPGNPFVVISSGFLGLKNIHPQRFARFCTKRGYPCFAFDYRGFGKSAGVRGQVLIGEQVRDIANGLAYLSTHERLKNRRIVLMGWGMGAGLILEATRVSPLVRALIAMNGFYDAERTQEQVRGKCNWMEFQRWLLQERCRLTRSRENSDYDPFQIYPLDGVTQQYVDSVLRKNPGIGTRVGMEFATSLLLFAPEERLSHLESVPILVVHGERNALHPPAEAKSLYDRYPGPRMLHWIPGAGHTEWMMDDHPSFQSLVGYIDQWIQGLG